ncbi:hypothetical protein GLOIN_2v1877952 [Rhizophagus clarus]|uniref:F-box domain-containing protein n=2 Tax=Rhizophagus clarus TaxID=94130 RepID=A0A8H3LP77_9GLOM|nr:hypothetical protein GLOIN_2v1877952 [Rhizophagus clarus]
MSKLNRDILYLIFEELQDDKKTLYSSLSIDKTCCEIIVPILWRNPWKYLTKENIFILFKIVISHLTDESKNNLKAHGIDFSTISYQKLLFNYISFCKHLDLNAIDSVIRIVKRHYSNSTFEILKNEIYNLFINENTKFTHLYLPKRFDYQIHLIPGAEQCISEIVFLSCYTKINDDVLTGLAEICQSIEKLHLFSERKCSKYGIIKLIDSFKKLTYVRLITDLTRKNYHSNIDEFHITLGNSLMKHAHTIQHFEIELPVSNFSLAEEQWLDKIVYKFLEDISLPSLQILKSDIANVTALRNLIVNANGSLTEISFYNLTHRANDIKIIIETIYQSCPNLKYLKLKLINENLLELEQLLINCQYLNGLHFIINNDRIYWYKLFKMLTISSPTSLFKFKFFMFSQKLIQLESFKSFFMNWRGRQPMLLQLDSYEYTDLIEEYKSEGIIKKFDYLDFLHRNFEDFEW